LTNEIESTESDHSIVDSGRLVTSGAISGVIASVLFTALHQLVISDIWFSLIIMIVSGGLAGAAIAWAYTSMTETANIKSWVAFNSSLMLLYVALTVVSIAVFDPVTTVGALIEANEPADELIGQAMPMTVIFTVGSAILITAVFGNLRKHFVPVLIMTIVLVLTLGLNVSIIGLVSFPSGTVYLVFEMLGLIAFLGISYMLLVAVLRRRTFGYGERG
jgi:hypothetical protein